MFFSEWFPKSFQSKLAKERNLVGIRCSSSVEMMARNQIAPFHFSRTGVFYVLALRYHASEKITEFGVSLFLFIKAKRIVSKLIFYLIKIY